MIISQYIGVIHTASRDNNPSTNISLPGPPRSPTITSSSELNVTSMPAGGANILTVSAPQVPDFTVTQPAISQEESDTALTITLHTGNQPSHHIHENSGRPQRKRGRINVQDLSKCVCGESAQSSVNQIEANSSPTTIQCKQKLCETQWVRLLQLFVIQNWLLTAKYWPVSSSLCLSGLHTKELDL